MNTLLCMDVSAQETDFYIDTDGDTYICPFCSNKVGNALQLSAKEMIRLLGQHACFDFDFDKN